jgi:hypothetical protein
MQNKEVVEGVDKCLRNITKVNSLFGGIPVVLGGNWAQILPVVPRGSHGNIVNACLQQSYVWPSLQKVFLRQNMRAVGPRSEPYAEWLRQMSSNPAFFRTLELPQFFTVVHDLDELLFAVFPVYRLCPADDNYQWYARRAILAPLNETVKKINLKLLGEFEGNVQKLYALDRADVND